jgi:hypothetical protein
VRGWGPIFVTKSGGGEDKRCAIHDETRFGLDTIDKAKPSKSRSCSRFTRIATAATGVCHDAEDERRDDVSQRSAFGRTREAGRCHDPDSTPEGPPLARGRVGGDLRALPGRGHRLSDARDAALHGLDLPDDRHPQEPDHQDAIRVRSAARREHHREPDRDHQIRRSPVEGGPGEEARRRRGVRSAIRRRSDECLGPLARTGSGSGDGGGTRAYGGPHRFEELDRQARGAVLRPGRPLRLVVPGPRDGDRQRDRQCLHQRRSRGPLRRDAQGQQLAEGAAHGIA